MNKSEKEWYITVSNFFIILGALLTVVNMYLLLNYIQITGDITSYRSLLLLLFVCVMVVCPLAMIIIGVHGLIDVYKREPKRK